MFLDEYFPHNAVHRACEKEQRRRMMDYRGPELIKKANANQIAHMLRLPFRGFHDAYGFSDVVDVGYVSQYDKTYSSVIKSEETERARRIEEFEPICVEWPYNLSGGVRESSTYCAEQAPEHTVETQKYIICTMRKLQKSTKEEKEILHKEVHTGWLSFAMGKIQDVVKYIHKKIHFQYLVYLYDSIVHVSAGGAAK